MRKPLYGLAVQAGTTDAERPEEVTSLVQQAGKVFHFLEHHARNEDRFLVPMMEAKSLEAAARLRSGHGELDAEVEALRKRLDNVAGSPPRLHAFYLALNAFLARYLVHLHEEEDGLLPVLHARFTDAELGEFSRQSVAATSPEDQTLMLGHMFPAMQAREREAFLAGLRAKAPPAVVAHVEGIARRALGQ